MCRDTARDLGKNSDCWTEWPVALIDSGVFRGAAAHCQILHKDSQNDGCCDGRHHNTNTLGKTPRQTAARVHLSNSFPATVWPAPCRKAVTLLNLSGAT